MRDNFIVFTFKNIGMFAKQHIILSIFLLLCLLMPPLYAKYDYDPDRTNTIRDLQLLLSLSGSYTGPMDGQCNIQTRQALNESAFAKARRDRSFEVTCDGETLELIKNDLISALNTGVATTQNVIKGPNGVNSETSVARELDDIKASIRNTNAALKGIIDGFSSNFLNQYNSLASIGVTIFLAGISGTIAIIAVVSNFLRDFITKNVEKIEKTHAEALAKAKDDLSKMIHDAENSHSDALAKCKNDLSDMVCTAKDQVTQKMDTAGSALLMKLWAILGGQSIFLYKNIKIQESHRRPLYMSYLRVAAQIAKLGNEEANRLCNLHSEHGTELADDDKEYLICCRNNFVFYVASMNDKYASVQFNEDDVRNVRRGIDELENMTSRDNNKFWYDVKDTIIWAKLALGMIKASDAKREVDLLMADQTIPVKWKQDFIERYEFYDRFEEHTDKIFPERV